MYVRSTRRSTRILLALLLAGMALAPAAGAASRTFVSFSFDDGTADQFAAAPVFAKHGVKASFFVNSARIQCAAPEADDCPDRNPYYMTLRNLRALYAAGHEVGGHTLSHPENLTSLPDDEQIRQICEDRQNLLNWGFAATSFAYPFGANAVTEARVQGCGYNAANQVGGIKPPDWQAGDPCGECPPAESVPPRAAFRTRTPNGVTKDTTLAQLQRYVVEAERSGGGWLQFITSQICAEGATCGHNSISPATLDAFLAWVTQRRDEGTIVRTVQQIIGGELEPVPTAAGGGGGAGSPGAAPLPKPQAGSGVTLASGDTTAPIVAQFWMTRRRFAPTPRGTGTMFRYLLSEPARLRVAIQRGLPGRRVGKSCRRPTSANAGRRRCTRFQTLTVLTRSAAEVSGRLRFSGRIGVQERKLRGTYFAAASARDAAGNVSKTRRLKFVVR